MPCAHQINKDLNPVLVDVRTGMTSILSASFSQLSRPGADVNRVLAQIENSQSLLPSLSRPVSVVCPGTILKGLPCEVTA